MLSKIIKHYNLVARMTTHFDYRRCHRSSCASNDIDLQKQQTRHASNILCALGCG